MISQSAASNEYSKWSDAQKHEKQRKEVLSTCMFSIKLKSINVYEWVTNILSYVLQYFESINSFLTFKSGNLFSKIEFL